MLDAQRNMGALALFQQDFFALGGRSPTLDHDPVLCAVVVVHLQAELGAGARGDTLDLVSLAQV